MAFSRASVAPEFDNFNMHNHNFATIDAALASGALNQLAPGIGLLAEAAEKRLRQAFVGRHERLVPPGGVLDEETVALPLALHEQRPQPPRLPGPPGLRAAPLLPPLDRPHAPHGPAR